MYQMYVHEPSRQPFNMKLQFQDPSVLTPERAKVRTKRSRMIGNKQNTYFKWICFSPGIRLPNTHKYPRSSSALPNSQHPQPPFHLNI
jgi:hypothetical protein